MWLELPSGEHRDSFIEGIAELRRFGTAEDTWFGDIDVESFADFLLALEGRCTNVDPSLVPCTIYWMVDEDGYAGRIALRHCLNEKLQRIGGHIGFVVRPSKRGRGYANEALRLVLGEAKNLGLDRVLLTCDEPNIASRRVIESNGGVLENAVYEDGVRVLRFWITLHP